MYRFFLLSSTDIRVRNEKLLRKIKKKKHKKYNYLWNVSYKDQNNPFSYRPHKWDRVRQSEGLLGFFIPVGSYLNFSQVHTFIPGIELSLHSEIKQKKLNVQGQRIWNTTCAVGFLTLVFTLGNCDLPSSLKGSPLSSVYLKAVWYRCTIMFYLKFCFKHNGERITINLPFWAPSHISLISLLVLF